MMYHIIANFLPSYIKLFPSETLEFYDLFGISNFTIFELDGRVVKSCKHRKHAYA